MKRFDTWTKLEIILEACEKGFNDNKVEHPDRHIVAINHYVFSRDCNEYWHYDYHWRCTND